MSGIKKSAPVQKPTQQVVVRARQLPANQVGKTHGERRARASAPAPQPPQPQAVDRGNTSILKSIYAFGRSALTQFMPNAEFVREPATNKYQQLASTTAQPAKTISDAQRVAFLERTIKKLA